ncbi:hypothetical protein GQ44DRAFT_640296, partial [Phaeosphaeriaceae sp. PMI808]
MSEDLELSWALGNCTDLKFSWGSTNCTDSEAAHPTGPKFKDCGLGNEFYADYFALNYTYPYVRGGAFIRYGLSECLSTRGYHESPPDHAIAQWWDRNSDKLELQIPLLKSCCLKDLCPLLGWQGNPDVAGRGMLTTYLVQALLITIYLPVLLAIRHNKVPKSVPHSPLLRRIVIAVQHSTATILNASLVFCVAMLLALLVTFSERMMHQDERLPDSFYNMSILMAFYSVFPAALMQMAASRMLRRAQGREFIWMFVITLLLVTSVLGVLSYLQKGLFFSRSQDKETQKQRQWEDICLSGPGYNNMGDTTGRLVLSLGCLLASISLITTIRRFILKLRQPDKTAAKKRCCIRVLWWITLSLGFALMWFLLAWFIMYRKYMEGRAGASNKDTEWSFGQILALGTWAPVFVEFGYLFWHKKPVDALNGRLIDPYIVVEKLESSDLTEIKEVPRHNTV